jgi:hypothetical protein
MWREHDATLAALWRRDETGTRVQLAGDPVTEPPDVAEPVARPT